MGFTEKFFGEIISWKFTIYRLCSGPGPLSDSCWAATSPGSNRPATMLPPSPPPTMLPKIPDSSSSTAGWPTVHFRGRPFWSNQSAALRRSKTTKNDPSKVVFFCPHSGALDCVILTLN